MRRATLPFAGVMLAVAFAPLPAHAAAEPVTAINGIGLIDYHAPPNLKIGTWVKYHVTGRSALGMSDDYFVTVVIAGEERFWGDDGFWVETLTELPNRPGVAVATLMSYSIFRDSLAFPHMQYYVRKTCNEIDEQGNPVEVVGKRPPETLVSRNRQERDMKWYIDTLGTDTVRTQRGAYHCRKVEIKQAVGASIDQGDSSIYNEVRESRYVYVTDLVPLTHIAREDIEHIIKRKTWLIGRSQDAPERIREHAVGTAELVDFGDNYEPQMVRPAFRRSLKEQDRAAAAPLKRKPSARKPG